MVAAALELGDEHAVKLAEVAERYYERFSDERYLLASTLATAQITRSPTCTSHHHDTRIGPIHH